LETEEVFMTTATFTITHEDNAVVEGILSAAFRCLHKGREQVVKQVVIYKPGFTPRNGSPVPDKYQRAWYICLNNKLQALAESRESAEAYLENQVADHT
jgi:hypothetical protein